MLEYACQYISLSTLEYTAVRWRLFHTPVSPEWGNALTLVELLISLLPPMVGREAFFTNETCENKKAFSVV